jgi:hypothetical protein
MTARIQKVSRPSESPRPGLPTEDRKRLERSYRLPSLLEDELASLPEVEPGTLFTGQGQAYYIQNGTLRSVSAPELLTALLDAGEDDPCDRGGLNP